MVPLRSQSCFWRCHVQLSWHAHFRCARQHASGRLQEIKHAIQAATHKPPRNNCNQPQARRTEQPPPFTVHASSCASVRQFCTSVSTGMQDVVPIFLRTTFCHSTCCTLLISLSPGNRLRLLATNYQLSTNRRLVPDHSAAFSQTPPPSVRFHPPKAMHGTIVGQHRAPRPLAAGSQQRRWGRPEPTALGSRLTAIGAVWDCKARVACGLGSASGFRVLVLKAGLASPITSCAVRSDGIRSTHPMTCRRC